MENNKRWERATLGLIDIMNAVWGNPEQSEQEKKEFLECVRKKMNESDNKVLQINDMCFCPHCRLIINFIDYHQDCARCGKKIDWSEHHFCCQMLSQKELEKYQNYLAKESVNVNWNNNEERINEYCSKR